MPPTPSTFRRPRGIQSLVAVLLLAIFSAACTDFESAHEPADCTTPNLIPADYPALSATARARGDGTIGARTVQLTGSQGMFASIDSNILRLRDEAGTSLRFIIPAFDPAIFFEVPGTLEYETDEGLTCTGDPRPCGESLLREGTMEAEGSGLYRWGTLSGELCCSDGQFRDVSLLVSFAYQE